jgi:hypothetical protein
MHISSAVFAAHLAGCAALSTVVTRGSTDFLSPAALEKAQAGNKWEKVKLAKGGEKAFQDVYEFAAAVRSGKYTWEELDVDDADIRYLHYQRSSCFTVVVSTVCTFAETLCVYVCIAS